MAATAAGTATASDVGGTAVAVMDWLRRFAGIYAASAYSTLALVLIMSTTLSTVG